MTDRSPPRWRPITSNTRSVRLARQRGGHLVEHQHGGFDGQRSGEVDDALRGQRNVARHVRQISILQPEFSRPVPEGLDWCLSQAQVGAQVEVRDQRGLLIDRYDPVSARLAGRPRDELMSAHRNPAAVRSHHHQ